MNRILIINSVVVLLLLVSCAPYNEPVKERLKHLLEKETLAMGKLALSSQPVSITEFVCERSAGNANEFYSEGDYWWPDPQNPEGPYIRRDGETNPDNFVAHRHAMIRMSRIVAELTSAYLISGNDDYARHALRHLYAWFVDPATRMRPHLLYAQAIKGRVTGRGIGIIDTIQLIEVAQSIIKLQEAEGIDDAALVPVVDWFAGYLEWLTTHPFGIDEREAKNNHGTCWVMQVAAFAKLTNNQVWMDYCRQSYKTVLLPGQMAVDGSFPLETARTKPYGYSLFNLDAMATICQILSTDYDNLWEYETDCGRSIKRGIEFLLPYVIDKSNWPFQEDVMHWDEWPVAHAFLLFSALQFNDEEQFHIWKNLERHPETDEVIRNMPIRNPIIWF